MSTAVIKTVAFAKPFIAKSVLAKPSEAMLRKVETLLTITLLAQSIGLVVRYAL